MKIIRVFPRRTKLTPDDENVVINKPPMIYDEADEIHVSVLFKHDRSRGHELAEQWDKNEKWKQFQREWARPAIIYAKGKR